MADNPSCYWVEEYGAYELCADANLPPLPEYWVRWDQSGVPVTVAGRTSQPFEDGQAAGASKPMAGNDIIVNATFYPYGDHVNSYSMSTYGAIVSDDHGFTYGQLVEYSTWQQGSAYGGYDATNGYWDTICYHYGTRCDFDEVSGRFVILNSIGTNEGNVQPASLILRTAISTDGLSWTVTDAATTIDYVAGAAAYDGDLWMFSFDGVYADWVSYQILYRMGYSSNDGTSWSFVDLTDLILVPDRNAPRDEFIAISANSTGCHVLGEAYQTVTFDYGYFYWRPTSKSTWASPVVLFDHDNNFPSAAVAASPFGCAILACQVNDHDIIVAATMGDDYGSFWIRKSTNAGATWGTHKQIIALDYAGPYGESVRWQQAENPIHIVELADGRLVAVIVYEAYYPGYETSAEGAHNDFPGWTAYTVSEDQGDNWSELTLVSPFWVSDQEHYGERLEVCAKGVDVVITCTARRVGSYTQVIRPTSTPDPQFLRPPSMVLPATPTQGFP